jgi:hypothetical protein
MSEKFVIRPGEPLPEAYVKAAMGEDVLLPGEVLIPREYVESIGTLTMYELRKANFTKGVEVQVNTEEPQMAITLARKIGGGYVLTTDCAAAWANKMDPQEVARSAVRRLMGEVEAGRLTN